MKKVSSKVFMIAALLVAGAAFVSCEKENIATEYTMTVVASKGDNGAKQLILNEHTLNATWVAGERVTVYNETKSAALEGYLEAQGDGASTTLSGTLNGTIAKNDVLTLKFLSPNYNNQEGTIEYIAANCDYAEATVTVATVNEGNITTTADANFQNQQAIVKFTLTDNASTPADLNTSELVVAVPGTTITVTPATATNVLYVAIPGISGQTVSLSAYKEYCYIYSKNQTGVTLNNGQYYEITARMTRTGIDLSRVPVPENYWETPIVTSVTAQDGDIITGTLGTNCEVLIASGASVTLNNMTIDLYKSLETAAMTCLGNATINLVGTNTLSPHNGPGIFVPSGSTLTIDGSGSLAATGGNGCPGIGASKSAACGDITITGGTINATGYSEAAGIGSSKHADCGDITITGGNVTATGNNSAGIGSAIRKSCGDITITGGTVNATGNNSAGIGSGYQGGCGTISIDGGDVTATAGQGGAGIGSGNYEASCTSISITGGTVNASGGAYGGAGIGSGRSSSCGDVTITSGVISVTATAGTPPYNKPNPSSIGAGTEGSCGTVTIASGANVTQN